MKNLDLMLKNVALEETLSFERHISSTSNDIWGKYVIRVDKNNVAHEDEVENWYVRIPLTNNNNIEQFVETAKKLLSEFEIAKIREKELEKSRWQDYIMYQLCDWKFLENYDGTVIKDGVVTFVKYAIVLKKLEDTKVEGMKPRQYMNPELGTTVYCIYDERIILVEKVGYLGKDSFIIADFSDCTEIDSLKWDYDCYNETWFTDLEKAKTKLTKIAIEDGWMDFKIIQVDDGCYILEDNCE